MLPECLLVIIGAGASYDCLTDHVPDRELDLTVPLSSPYGTVRHPLGHVRFPLTDSLARPNPFRNEILQRYSRAGVVLASLRHELDFKPGADSLEACLSAIQTHARSDAQLETALLHFRFYLRDLLLESVGYMHSLDAAGSVTNYMHLVSRLRSWARRSGAHICYVNFNYDPLLDLALNDVYGLGFTGVNGHTVSDEVSLLRPHGSVLWEWTLTQQDGSPATTQTLTRMRRATLGLDGLITERLKVLPTSLHDLDWRSMASALETGDPIGLPALALPVDGKNDETMVWPDDQAAFLGDLARRFTVNKLLTVGWRGAEPHFLPKLAAIVARNRQMSLQVVAAGKDATSTASELLADLHLDNPLVIRRTDGFGGLIRSDGLAEWLRRSP